MHVMFMFMFINNVQGKGKRAHGDFIILYCVSVCVFHLDYCDCNKEDTDGKRPEFRCGDARGGCGGGAFVLLLILIFAAVCGYWL